MMKAFTSKPVILFLSAVFFLLLMNLRAFSQEDLSHIEIRSAPAGGTVKMLWAENGFGGGNVAASIGTDGILLVDDMYAAITPKLIRHLKTFSDSSIRFVINTHFHSDHIQGNNVLGAATIIAHDNVVKRLKTKTGSAAIALPGISFPGNLTLHFNGEYISLFHLPNGHTDGDVFVYFPVSKVIHMGDTYFKGMFPAVYKEGGGDILQMINNLEKVVAGLPEDVAVIPGHGELASKKELALYIDMLKETTSLVAAAIQQGKSVTQMQEEKLLKKYDQLGDGGAQTTNQYLSMLYKLLSK